MTGVGGVIGTAVVGKLTEILVDPTLRQFGYLLCFNSNLQNLTSEFKALEHNRADVQGLVNEAKWKLKVPTEEAKAWLENVGRTMNEAKEVLEGMDRVTKGCLNLKDRYLLSRKSVKLKARIVELLEGSNKVYNKSSTAAPPAGRASASLTHGFEDFPSWKKVMDRIMEALESDQITMVGVCGMGGVGKTTMAKKILAIAGSGSQFKEVAMAVVSQNEDLIKIQDQLADWLGLKFEEKSSISARANKLCRRLSDGGKNILIILDDVWKGLDLGEIGIPFGEGHKRCKILLTSRLEDMCTRMGTQKNFSVQELSEPEARLLFGKMAGNIVEREDIHPIAMEVLNVCGRLPLAIVTLGKALKDREEFAWKDALRKLKKSEVAGIPGMNEKVFASIKLSYNFLETDQHRRVLLLCCLFREYYEIDVEDLFRYAYGLGFFKDLNTLEDTRNSIDTLVEDLKRCYLLLRIETQENIVKMHDVVRDVCLSIASKGDHLYLVNHDTEEWPRRRDDPYTAISFTKLKANFQFPADLNCSSLELLRFQGSSEYLYENSMDISENMRVAKVISLREFSLIKPPMESPHNVFTNLRTLCLEDCELDENMSWIWGLQNLEILSLYGSYPGFEIFPSEIGQLCNLKLLDLRTAWPITIPSGFYSGLEKLEELYLGGSRPRSAELGSLSNLKTLELQTTANGFAKLGDIFVQRLTRFNIRINFPEYRRYRVGQNRHKNENFNSLMAWNLDLSMPLQTLSARTENLHLYSVKGLKNVVKDKELCQKGYPKLKFLWLRHCDELEYVIVNCDHQLDSLPAFINLEVLVIEKCDNLDGICHGNLPTSSFSRLQSVYLSSLPSMTYLWRGPIQSPCFGNITSLHVNSCLELTSLLTQSVSKCLVQLETLTMENCQKVKVLVSEDSGEEDKVTDQEIVFPKLKVLTLDGLPMLESFCIEPQEEIHGSDGGMTGQPPPPLFTQRVVLHAVERLKISDVGVVEIMSSLTHAESLDNLKRIKVYGCSKLQNVARPYHTKILQNLERVNVHQCNSMKAVFDYEGLEVRGECTDVVFGQLQSIVLESLPMLTHIWRMLPKQLQGFQNLSSLDICQCDSLRYLISPSLAKMLLNLKELKLQCCKMVKEAVMEEEQDKDKECQATEVTWCCMKKPKKPQQEVPDKVVFSKLCVLILEDLPNLAIFCSGNQALEFPLLEDLVIGSCPNMNIFCSRTVHTPKLKQIIISNSEQPCDLVGDLNETIQHLKDRMSVDNEAMKEKVEEENKDVEDDKIAKPDARKGVAEAKENFETKEQGAEHKEVREVNKEAVEGEVAKANERAGTTEVENEARKVPNSKEEKFYAEEDVRAQDDTGKAEEVEAKEEAERKDGQAEVANIVEAREEGEAKEISKAKDEKVDQGENTKKEDEAADTKVKTSTGEANERTEKTEAQARPMTTNTTLVSPAMVMALAIVTATVLAVMMRRQRQRG